MSISIHVTSFSLNMDENCQKKKKERKKPEERKTVACYVILGKIFRFPWFVEEGTKGRDF